MDTQEQAEFRAWEGGITATAPVVMLDGPFGSGIEELAAMLAERLGVPAYDPHRLESLAQEREAHDGAWRHLREGVGSFFEYWLSHLHEKPGMSRSEHLAYLEETLAQVAREGGVIAGVCPHMLLDSGKVFRVKVAAAPERCALRLAMLRGVSLEEAVTVFHRMEEERHHFLRELFDDAYADPVRHDLVLDAESTTPEEMLEVCVAALDSKGLLAKAA